MKKKSIIALAVVVIMVVFIVFAIKNKPAAEETIGGYKDAPRVQVAYVEKQDIDTKVSSSGKLEAVHTKTLYLDTANKVVALHKEVGDTVKMGELIITLDKEAQIEAQNQKVSLEKKLEAAKQELSILQGTGSEGDILSAKANIATLQDTKEKTEKAISEAQNSITILNSKIADQKNKLKLNEELSEEGLAADQDVEDIKTAINDLEFQKTQLQNTIATSKASLSTVDLQIQNAQYALKVLQNKVTDKNKQAQITAKQSAITDIENQLKTNDNTISKASTEVIAPMDGVITYLPDEEGMSLQPGSQLVTIVDPTHLKVTCDVSTYYIPDLKVGLDAIIKYTGSKTVEVPGKVSKVSPVATTEKTANGETTGLPVQVDISEPGDVIRPGINVDVKIVTDSRVGACVVPILAIEEDDDMSYVYVVKEDGTLEKREVTQGISNGLNIEVTGVKEGEIVVSSLEDYVEDGAKVSYEKIGDNQ